jgi:hypothetical protein
MYCHHRTNNSLHHPEMDHAIYKEREGLVEGIVSSIPFPLAADLQVFLKNATASTPSLIPGRPVGFLLLIHELYVLSTMPMVEPKLKVYTRDCLAWIGDRMGIGQATKLSKVRYG